MINTALRCVGLTKSFKGTDVVSNLNLEVVKGEILALLGPSGCGKTTTLRLIAGFESPDSGVIEIDSQIVANPNVYTPPEKRHIGVVFQDYALFPHLTVAGNMSYGLAKGHQRDARVRMISSLLDLVNLQSRMPHELSGGEQQRVALARALVPKPAIVLLDEPFSNLDAKLRQQVREEVKEALQRSGATALFVTHDQEEALYMGDRVAILNKGHMEQIGTPLDVYQTPATDFVARFIGTADFLPVTFKDNSLWTEAGPLSKTTSRFQEGLEALIRPENVRLHPSKEGQGRIISRIYHGAFTLYSVILDSGDTLHSMGQHDEACSVGTRIEVVLNQDRPIVCFRDGKAVLEDDLT